MSEGKSNQSSKEIDWRLIIVGAMSAAFGAFATMFVGGLDYFNKNRELDIKLIDVGLSILRGEATGDRESLQARKFALRLLERYANIDIPQDEFDQWAERGTTPFKPTGRDYYDTFSPSFLSESSAKLGVKATLGLQRMMAYGCPSPFNSTVEDYAKLVDQSELDDRTKFLCKQLEIGFSLELPVPDTLDTQSNPTSSSSTDPKETPQN